MSMKCYKICGTVFPQLTWMEKKGKANNIVPQFRFVFHRVLYKAGTILKLRTIKTNTEVQKIFPAILLVAKKRIEGKKIPRFFVTTPG